MSNNYEVTIIFPIYNVEKYIKESLLSALNQSFKSIEYILVDDCGSDESMKVAQDIVKSHPRYDDVKFIHHKKNMGLSEARNTGIVNASGRYIFFLDSDDDITEKCIDLHYQKIISTDADFTVAHTKLEGVKSVHVNNIRFEMMKGIDVLGSFLKRKWLVSAWNKLYRSKFILDNNIRFVPNRLHEDGAWGFDIAKSAHKIAMVNEETYIYKIRGNSITTSTVGEKRLNDALYMINYTYNYRNNICNSLEKDFNKYISFLKFKHALVILRSNLTEDKKTERYNNLKNIKTSNSICMYALMLKLSYVCFKAALSIPYYLYKRLQ